MTSLVPVMDAARGEARNATRSATSVGRAGWPMRIPPSEAIKSLRAVVDDVAQDVGVAARGHVLEEVAADEFAALGDASLLDERPCVGQHMGLVEQDALSQ